MSISKRHKNYQKSSRSAEKTNSNCSLSNTLEQFAVYDHFNKNLKKKQTEETVYQPNLYIYNNSNSTDDNMNSSYIQLATSHQPNLTYYSEYSSTSDIPMDSSTYYYSPMDQSYQNNNQRDMSQMDTTQSSTYECSEQLLVLNQVLTTESENGVYNVKDTDASKQADFVFDFNNLDLVDFELDNSFCERGKPYSF